MGLPVENNDRLTTASELLLDVFQSKANFIKLLSSYVQETQALEAMLFELLDAFYVGTAVGDQLDAIGETVGVDRQGADDDRYRTRIRARIKLNLSSGTINELLSLAKLLQPAGVSDPVYTPNYPAGFFIDYRHSAVPFTQVQADEVWRALNEGTPAGVKLQFFYGLSPTTSLFRFSSSATVSDSDPNKGFADTAQTTGGKLAGNYGTGTGA